MFGDFAEEDIANLRRQYPDVFVSDGVDFKIYVNRFYKTDTVKSSETKETKSKEDNEDNEDNDDWDDDEDF